ncbi:UDP-glucose 6-dehydrogenase [Pseudomonas aeruginosa]|uniref:UDP-glucose 6-dehydrogenase n=1 Tax=Pseudomonas aeruginosa TaxID=287 RepID=UPI00104A3832|nr:UDP-glucose 6-dehydrogenase [Pseudomonas aeruginosa]
MKISVFGSGYVGLVQAAVLAEVGHDVLCMDIDRNKVERLAQGLASIYEPGLDALLREGLDSGRLRFSSDARLAVEHGRVQFIAVGTPPGEDGAADLGAVFAVADAIAEHRRKPVIVVEKSTVPVGTGDRLRAHIERRLEADGRELEFEIVSNPEFLKEGSAVADCRRPDRIVVGCDNEEVRQVMRELYEPFNRNHDRLLFMGLRSAELTKYAANGMLATKISFINQIAELAEHLGADIEAVRQGIGADPRIGYHFIYPGCGYGGSCFPKDMRALILWGLAFKPNTDDMRDAPSRELMEALWRHGAQVRAYDPEAMQETQRLYGHDERLSLMGTPEATLGGADALVICTEWQQFKAPDFELLKERLKAPVIFDGRNLYDPERMARHGFHYYPMGRGQSCSLPINEASLAQEDGVRLLRQA